MKNLRFPLSFAKSLDVKGGIFSVLILLSFLPAFSQTRQQTINGYAEFYKNGFLIVDGERIYTDQFTQFKKKARISLGDEVKVKGVRQANGAILASEIEAKENGTALFKVDALRSANEIERIQVSKGFVLEQAADGTLKTHGRIISGGPEQRRVQMLCNRLLPSYISPERVRVYIVENEEWNAHAMANGSIWVNTSLLRDMSEDELAIILGHELVHYTHEHIRREMKKQALINMGATAAESITKDAQAQQYIGLAFSAWKNRYSREYEDQADRVGLRYAYEAGFDVAKGINVWKRFLDKYGESDKLTNLVFGDHSRDSERLRHLQNELTWNYLPNAR